MKKNIYLFLVFLAAGIVLFISFSQKTEKEAEIRNFHKISNFDESQFILGVDKAEKLYGHVSRKNIKGGIVPHHLVASHMIAGFFQSLSAEKPKKIIILGPNHTEVGDFKVLTGLYDWETPYGMVEADTDIVNRLVLKNLAKVDEEILSSDQAVTAILPYIEFYLPGTKVTPLLLSSRLNDMEIEQLATDLSDLIKEKDTLLVASVDFSHYLGADTAEKNDGVSFDAIQKSDCRRIMEFDSDFMDSPAAVCTLIQTLEESGKTKIEVIDHSNSFKILGEGESNVTSYYSILFSLI